MMKSMICLSLVLLPLITVVEGGWSSILNPPAKFPVNALDPKIVEIAKFAVEGEGESCTRRSSEEPGIGRRFGIAA
ncbi:hypothetical protein YC2023_092421 [Brassica napus]